MGLPETGIKRVRLLESILVYCFELIFNNATINDSKSLHKNEMKKRNVTNEDALAIGALLYANMLEEVFHINVNEPTYIVP